MPGGCSVARQRDYRAEYAARKARAAAKGITGQAAHGHQKRAAAAAERKVERARAAAAKRAQQVARRPTKRVPLHKAIGPATRTTTRSGAALLAAVDEAATKGHHVAITVTLRFAGGYRTATTDRYTKVEPGKTPLRLAGELRPPDDAPRNRAGRVPDQGARPDGPAPGGKAIILTGPKSALASGSIPAADLASYLRMYVNPWDGVADLIGEGER